MTHQEEMGNDPANTPKCAFCNRTLQSGYEVWPAGFICTDPTCDTANREKATTIITSAMNYDLEKMPQRLTVADFEDFVMAITVRGILKLSKADIEKYGEAAGPKEVSLNVKAKILAQLDTDGVSDVQTSAARDGSRMFYGGSFWFEHPIPRLKILKAARTTGFVAEGRNMTPNITLPHEEN